jgi:hypothetical protein
MQRSLSPPVADARRRMIPWQNLASSRFQFTVDMPCPFFLSSYECLADLLMSDA